MAGRTIQAAKRVMIFRFGSIGDFAVAVPSLHLIRNGFPDAEIALLSNQPENSRVASSESVLDGSGLVDRHLKYAGGPRSPRQLIDLWNAIRRYDPDVFVYLAPERHLLLMFRDYFFFRLCGLRSIVGLPRDFRLWKSAPPMSGTFRWEQEARRLVRLLAPLGTIDLENPEKWSLNLSHSEHREAARLLDENSALKSVPVIAASLGTKQAINDWGDSNWRTLFDAIKDPRIGLVMIGSSEDRDRSDKFVKAWPGPTLNLCGRVAPRIGAAVLQRAILFLGHDSGPMHLAAAVDTPCVAVFSKRNLPGIWYPLGRGHRIIYPCWRNGTIDSIRPRQVIAAVTEQLEKCANAMRGQADSPPAERKVG